MKKVILQYLASALTVILILGLVVFNRQRNHSLVKKVKDPEISYIYQDSLENIDKIAHALQVKKSELFVEVEQYESV